LAAARDFFWGEFCDWYLELIKRRLQEGGQPAEVARQVLAFVLDQALRLLHPFLPFITEQLWKYLDGLAPRRGVDAEVAGSELCATAQWPRSRPEWQNGSLEEEFERLKGVISRLRELRSRYRVPPSKPLPGAVKVSGKALKTLKKHEALIAFMARLSDLQVGVTVKIPVNAATQVIDDVEVFLGDVLDPEKERSRLERQKEKLTQQLEAGQRKLANEDFVSRAPSEIVEAERRKVQDLESQLATLEKSLESLNR
jgi:valyl-tRNA synthetase